MREGSLFSTPSPAFIVCRFFDDGHSEQCEVILHCSFLLLLLFNFIFIYLLVALGLHCPTWAFSSWIEQGLLFVVACGLLIAVVSLVAELRL